MPMTPRNLPGRFNNTMQYFYTNEKGKKEEVALEAWMWGVIYKDDSELLQFGPDGVFHRLGEIKQDEVKIFVLICNADPSRRIDIVMPRGARLIHKYRNYILNQGTADERHVRCYMFGYRCGDQYHYNYVLPDGRILQSNSDNVALTEFNI